MKSVPIEKIREMFDYDPATGHLLWRIKNRKSPNRVGTRAGCINPIGYRVVGIGDSTFLEHRVILALLHGVWPSQQVDHINGIRDDNRVVNLRNATVTTNGQNAKRRVDNTTGFKGVSLHRQPNGRTYYRARLMVDGRVITLCPFDTPEAAHVAYTEAALKHFGEFARSE